MFISTNRLAIYGSTRANTGCDAGAVDQWRPANGVIYLVDTSREWDDVEWEFLAAVRTACQASFVPIPELDVCNPRSAYPCAITTTR